MYSRKSPGWFQCRRWLLLAAGGESIRTKPRRKVRPDPDVRPLRQHPAAGSVPALLNDLNVHPKVVADQLGHTVDVNQNVYTKTGLGRRKKAVNSLEFALGNL